MQTLNYNDKIQTLTTEEIEPKNYFNMFVQLLNADECFLNLIIQLERMKLNKDDKYKKYIAKPTTADFYKKHLYQPNEILQIENIINYIHFTLIYNKEYAELKEHYYKPLRGSCVMGIHLYCFYVPKNLRKQTPEKKSLFTLGYSNGEGHIEYLQETYKDVLEVFNIKILYDGGNMD
jgi:hypothetical protein